MAGPRKTLALPRSRGPGFPRPTGSARRPAGRGGAAGDRRSERDGLCPVRNPRGTIADRTRRAPPELSRRPDRDPRDGRNRAPRFRDPDQGPSAERDQRRSDRDGRPAGSPEARY